MNETHEPGVWLNSQHCWIKTKGIGGYWPEVDIVLNGDWRTHFRDKWDTWANSWLWKLGHAAE